MRALYGHAVQNILPLLTRRHGFAVFLANGLVDELDHRRASGQRALGRKRFKGHCGRLGSLTCVCRLRGSGKKVFIIRTMTNETRLPFRSMLVELSVPQQISKQAPANTPSTVTSGIPLTIIFYSCLSPQSSEVRTGSAGSGSHWFGKSSQRTGLNRTSAAL